MSTAPSLLWGRHDGLLCDLDGVVYAGGAALPDAVETLTALHEAGLPVAYVTNNASRAPETVAEQIGSYGIPVSPEQVFGSAAAGVELLRRRRPEPAGTRVLVVGSTFLRTLVEQAGYTLVDSAAEAPDAVLQGFDPAVGWQDLAQAAYAVNAGAVHIATNTDLTIPRAEGIAPGNGSLIAAVTQATGVVPEAAGKPEPLLFTTAATALGMRTPLMVGDRLDTDIAGGRRAGIATALVLTGIDTRETARTAPAELRPDHIIDTLAALLAPTPPDEQA